MEKLNIRFAKIKDSKVILGFIKKLADYEKLSHEVKATEQNLEKTLFSPNSNAESILGFYNNEPVAFALFFTIIQLFWHKRDCILKTFLFCRNLEGKDLENRC